MLILYTIHRYLHEIYKSTILLWHSRGVIAITNNLQNFQVEICFCALRNNTCRPIKSALVNVVLVYIVIDM